MFRRIDATESITRLATRFGDLVHTTAFGRHIYQLNHPTLIEDFFLKDAAKHHRGMVMQRARVILGDGLLTSEEPTHMRQRRLAQPAFHRQRIAAYGETIGREAVRISASWQPGTTTDLHESMLELALRIVGKCLFDLDVNSRDEVRRISAAVDAFMGFLPLALLPFSTQIQRLPLPAMRRIRRGQAELDALIYGMIRERRAHPGDRGDLLSMLIEAADPEDPSYTMSDQQIHDECLTILLAGHETTANALSFALWLMAQHPDVQQRLHAEATAVFPGRAPNAADYGNLPYATQVFSEALRLYPPVWVTARTCVEPYEIARFTIPRGAILIAPQFVVHRDPRFFDEPLRFNPDRWTEAERSQRPRYTFFPFAAGSRQCIGEGLAWMEGVLSLATFARDWQLTPTPGSPAKIAVNPAISLRPKHGLALSLSRH
ncbi:cytochrome P450 [Granulicella sp. WH15]|nr:cytochrome P450 [Granulicella sp. WH15]